MIKIYHNVKENKEAKQMYKIEKQVYIRLYGETVTGFPAFYANGSLKQDNKHLVTSRHGFDLHTIHKICRRKFSYKTVLNIGIEILERLEKVHALGYSYNNLSPSSILIPHLTEVNQGTLYLKDFQKCKRFENDQQSEASLSKIEDMDSLFFMLAYLVKGSLPWGGHGEDIFRKEARLKVKPQLLQDFLSDLEVDFVKFYKYQREVERNILKKSNGGDDDRRSYHFTDEKSTTTRQFDYAKLKSIFFEALYQHQSDQPYRFDWYPMLTKIQRFNKKYGGKMPSDSKSRDISGDRIIEAHKVNKTAAVIQAEFFLKKSQLDTTINSHKQLPKLMAIQDPYFGISDLQSKNNQRFDLINKNPEELVIRKERSRSFQDEQGYSNNFQPLSNKKNDVQIEALQFARSPSFSNSDIDLYSNEQPSLQMASDDINSVNPFIFLQQSTDQKSSNQQYLNPFKDPFLIPRTRLYSGQVEQKQSFNQTSLLAASQENNQTTQKLALQVKSESNNQSVESVRVIVDQDQSDSRINCHSSLGDDESQGQERQEQCKEEMKGSEVDVQRFEKGGVCMDYDLLDLEESELDEGERETDVRFNSYKESVKWNKRQEEFSKSQSMLLIDNSDLSIVNQVNNNQSLLSIRGLNKVSKSDLRL